MQHVYNDMMIDNICKGYTSNAMNEKLKNSNQNNDKFDLNLRYCPEKEVQARK